MASGGPVCLAEDSWQVVGMPLFLILKPDQASPMWRLKAQILCLEAG